MAFLNITNSSSLDVKSKNRQLLFNISGGLILLGGEYCINSISIFPFKVMCFGCDQEAGCKGDIIVGNDVLIGTGAIICSWVKMGQDAVVIMSCDEIPLMWYSALLFRCFTEKKWTYRSLL